MANNLAIKFETKVAERYSLKSITDAYAGKDYNFNGVDTINVYTIDTVAMTDYTRSGLTRFGTANELGDTVQTMKLTKDRAFAFTIDKGNNAEQYNVKQSNKALQRQIDEVVTPEIDIYRLSKWAAGAGITSTDNALDTSNVLEAMFKAMSDMNDKKVPREGRTFFLLESVFNSLLLSNQVVGIDSLGNKTISTGKPGMIYGANVVPVPSTYMPSDTNFILKYKNSTVDPMKLRDYRIHTDPPGISGALVEGRFIYDSFVLDTKKEGIYVSKSA